MSGIPVSRSNAPRRLLATLKSWLGTEAHETWPSAEGPSAEPLRSQAHFYGSVRVLVADDNPVNLLLITALMRRRGLVPLLAADGAEAVALACELHFDLILMDLQMPVLGGLAATSAIRHFESTSCRPAVPVVAYSDNTPDASVLARHGMNGSLCKPCGDQDLEHCLARWCPTYRSAQVARQSCSRDMRRS